MNISTFLFSTGILAVIIAGSVGAQTPPGSSENTATGNSSLATPVVGGLSGAALTAARSANRAKVDTIKIAAKSSNRTSVEAALSRTSTRALTSAAGHLEASRGLWEAGAELASEGHVSGVKIVATLAIEHLDQAVSLSNDPMTKGQAKKEIGTIHERLLGDVPAAIASYRSAKVLDPNDPWLAQTLERLERMDAIFRSKIPANKTKR